jgi:hypothetical protein
VSECGVVHEEVKLHLCHLGEQWRNLRFVREVCGNHSHRDVLLFEPARKVIKPVATSRDESEVPSVSR